jgi:hypothetical protein
MSQPTNKQIEAICHDYAQRWFGEDWPLMEDDQKAELRIEAYRARTTASAFSGKTEMLWITTWRWGRKYDGHYVERLKAGVARRLRRRDAAPPRLVWST